MGRHAVITVGRILLQQLPVGADAVVLRADHDLHAVAALVGNVFEVFGRAGEIVAQRHRVPVVADEDEALELLHALDVDEIELAVLRRIGR